MARPRNPSILRAAQVHLLGTPALKKTRHTRLLMPEKALWLLTYLACQNRWVSREEMAALLWPDSDSSAARHSLRQLLQRLRSLRWTHTLETEPTCLRWWEGSDLHEFRRCAASGLWAEALHHHQGELLQGFYPAELEEFCAWLELERRQLHTQWMQVCKAQAQRLTQQNQPEAALQVLEHVLHKDPLAEHALQGYLRLARHREDRDRAGRFYQQFKQALQQEVGLEPSLETRQLYQGLFMADGTR
ncbi:AfsR/SARP family transcriptional regulator [Deinococcus roseus]|uniref:Bacterial transcriptional activator domain-containing protein n=1 Tax=Deinococcus roseus TaxID=392414 RepID=A0ABQ2CZH0_9DEIO|nr:BTAD domain-containing putative transcriptional regulator [Deinococcus roseus]GGJ35992.1 hypothetical protein GCM10008938_22640 [Deinococcus roseus]